MNFVEMAGVLKLPYLKEHAELILQEAKHSKMTHEEFLHNYLEHEIMLRSTNSIARKTRVAKFPYKKYMEDFETEKYNKDLQFKLLNLQSLKFIDNKENIIMIGNPGSGKTHFSIALGLNACKNGMNVLFISVPDLIIQLKEALSNRQIDNYKKKFVKYDLVILDELGYVSFDKEGCEILFNLLSARNDKGATIITSNLVFERWEEIFKDPMLTGALIDRLAHKAHILDMTVETSYRYEETVKWASKKSNK